MNILFPTVSVIVPIYGVANYIERCARSIFEQTYGGFEVIFVDDCSKDNSIAILKGVINEYPAVDCRIIRHERNRGLSAARNTGVKAASGKYILHVDSDDWIEPDMIGCLVKKATATNADIVICGNNIVYLDKQRVSFPRVYDNKTTMIKAMLFKSVPASMWGKLISREIYDRHEDAWSIEGIDHGEDYATMPRLMYYAGRIVYVQQALYNYNQTNQSSYMHNYSEKSMRSMLRADRVLDNFFKEILPEQTIDIMKLRTKADIIKQGNINLYPTINNLYKEEQKRSFNQLLKRDKLLLSLTGKGIDWFIGFLVKKYLQWR